MKTLQIPFLTCMLIFIGMSLTSCKQDTTEQQFKKLSWLNGKWLRTNPQPGQSGYETWSNVSATKLTGQGVTLEGNETVFVEQLELSIKDNEIFYIVSVTGEPKPVYFRMTSIAEDAFVCENPTHDFPKKISYTRNGNRIKAVISGDGKSVAYDFEKEVAK